MTTWNASRSSSRATPATNHLAYERSSGSASVVSSCVSVVLSTVNGGAESSVSSRSPSSGGQPVLTR